MGVQLYENESYFSMNVSLVFLQEISCKEYDRLWLEEKRLQILGQGDDSIDLGKMESLDAPKPMIIEFKSKETGMKD